MAKVWSHPGSKADWCTQDHHSGVGCFTTAHGSSRVKYINASANIDQDESMMEATLEQIGAWFVLLAYCHRQMNNGMIPNCQSWSDAKWGRLGLTAIVVGATSPLWHFSGLMLVVHHYNSQAELAYRKRQAQGRIDIEKRWAKQRAKKVVQMPSKSQQP